MNTIQKIEAIKKLIAENKSFSFLLKINQKYKELLDAIIEYTKKLNIKFIERIYWFINQLTDYPTCALPECNNKSVKFLSLQKGYKKYCSARCAARSDECKQKHITTCQHRYGVDNVAQAKNVQNKMQQTLLDRYGVTNIGAYAPNREKVKKTNMQRYGQANGHKKIDAKKIGSKISAVKCINYYNRILLNDLEIKPLFTVDEYINADYGSSFNWHCNKCGKDFSAKISYGDSNHIARCLNCYPHNSNDSIPESEILNFLKVIKPEFDIEQHNRKILYPLELDIFIPQVNLAIEFDGLYWHSDNVLQQKNYHLNKTNECEKQDIQLIHIFENEWLFKKDIVKSRLKNLFGIYDKTIFARKCEVKNIDSKTSKHFQENNHIQGAINSSVNLGLFFNNELISLMTFGKCRFDKKHEWELLRFCTKLGYHIPGGAGKLLKYFERTYNPKSLISYADRRWSRGKLYEALGFKLHHKSRPDYWYFRFKDFILQSRVKFQKHKLKNILDKFDENKTEVENMFANKYYRIFDCGNLVFEKLY